MKTTIFTLLFTSLFVISYGQNLRFSYATIHNGTTSEVRVFVNNSTSGTENMTGFTSNLYYNTAESSLISFDTSPSTMLGWVVDQGATLYVPNANTAIPISHSGFGTVNVIDLTITGTQVGAGQLHVLTINLDNTPGTAAASAVYLASSSENHSALEYVGNDFVGHPVIAQPASTLPIELLSFSAKALPSRVAYLTWATSSEINNQGFEVQRSHTNNVPSGWESIGFVKGNGTVSTASEYSFVDQAPLEGENMYRLKQIDMDGSFTYSKVRSLLFEKDIDIQVFPNPTANWIRVKFGEITDEKKVDYNFLDEKGSLIKSGFLYTKDFNRLNLSALADGVYILQILVNNQSVEKRIVKVN